MGELPERAHDLGSEMSKSWDSGMVLMGCVNYFDYGNHCDVYINVMLYASNKFNLYCQFY